MLTLKKHLKFHTPQLFKSSHLLVLSPVVDEDDELIQEINNQVALHDDNWTLPENVDGVQLDSFWQGVERDIADDPEWQRFDNE